VLTVADATRWVGLDVHASQTTIAVLDQGTGEISRAKLRGSPEKVVVEFLAGFKGRVIAVYEAGPTGMKLARVACERGIDLRVCAPGLIPRKPTDRIKTDARDAERLVRQLAAGGLSFVRVPSEEEEALRDLVRAREDARQDLSRARHRLSKMLLRRGLRYEAGSTWTDRHIDWIVRLKFDDLASRMVVGEYVNAVQQLHQRRKDLEATIEELLPVGAVRADRLPVALLPRSGDALGGRPVLRDR
jgi:transposase